MDNFRQVIVPMYEIDDEGAVLPNPLFHRTLDKLHSRCIEYPFAAAHIGIAKRILDIGTAKADPTWTLWLESLPIEVHATDYDSPDIEFNHIQFHQADIRKIPIQEQFFDKILAVSVIEHIGMEFPQVTSHITPPTGVNGDLDAVKELVRMLKIGGELIMTVPYGRYDLGSDKFTRIYTSETIKKFEKIVSPVSMEYYEYQYSYYRKICFEYSPKITWLQKMQEKLSHLKNKESPVPIESDRLPKLMGGITWRRIPLDEAQAIHYEHADGVLCGIWRKE